MANKGWIGVDLDGTVAKYDGFKGPTVIGEPIPAMVDRIKHWISEGIEVRIFTARVWAPSIDTTLSLGELGKRVAESRHARRAIEDWTELHIGKRLEVTCQKDYSMWVLYDDRAKQVEPNTGRVIGDEPVKSQKRYTLEEAYRLKSAIDKNTDYGIEPSDLHTIVAGVEVIQGTEYPQQKVFLHPFTLGNLIGHKDFNSAIDIVHCSREDRKKYLTPLTDQQIMILKASRQSASIT